MLGECVGRDGAVVGIFVGVNVGDIEGLSVIVVGDEVGEEDSPVSVGARVGLEVLDVGEKVNVGASVGCVG